MWGIGKNGAGKAVATYSWRDGEELILVHAIAVKPSSRPGTVQRYESVSGKLIATAPVGKR